MVACSRSGGARRNVMGTPTLSSAVSEPPSAVIDMMDRKVTGSVDEERAIMVGLDPLLNASLAVEEALGEGNYWDRRYQSLSSASGEESGNHEWLRSWEDLQGLLVRYMSSEDRILHVGCGQSDMGVCLAGEGFRRVTNMDISPAAIEMQKERHPTLEWVVGDGLRTGLPSDHFDVVIDKGTLDAIMCRGEGSVTWGWQGSQYVEEMHRILKPGGRYVAVSHGRPSRRLPVLRPSNIDLDASGLKRPFPKTLDWTLEVIPLSEEGPMGRKSGPYSNLEEFEEKMSAIRKAYEGTDTLSMEDLSQLADEVKRIHAGLALEAQELSPDDPEGAREFQKNWHEGQQVMTGIIQMLDALLPVHQMDWQVRQADHILYMLIKN
ncbi:unnamed protein product [Vitrella brassicaformis CCMP3155]|uniref:Methyltransferase type 11 domain-containing protein n=1 Tax=Vitrella brassicaformis (strain CCMP3155) TaxID=1169540 RepID=A0A0G4ED17_VITBC|nr:unnamed protein product [Vitrella brassicaformis CCMP3155]|eukprot:CEL93572.1 unnamed protein product [Vitrella brassicaformis CCMP3155]